MIGFSKTFGETYGTIMAENMSLCTFPTFLKVVAAWFTAYYTISVHT